MVSLSLFKNIFLWNIITSLLFFESHQTLSSVMTFKIYVRKKDWKLRPGNVFPPAECLDPFWVTHLICKFAVVFCKLHEALIEVIAFLTKSYTWKKWSNVDYIFSQNDSSPRVWVREAIQGITNVKISFDNFWLCSLLRTRVTFPSLLFSIQLVKWTNLQKCGKIVAITEFLEIKIFIMNGSV